MKLLTAFCSLFFMTVSVKAVKNTGVFPDSRIIGGALASPGQFPYQVYLQTKFFYGDSSCGGSIISPDWILTAAQCVYL